MNRSLIDRFCQSPQRRLIVAIVTTIVSLATLLPLADDYLDNHESRRTLAEELDQARQTAKSLPGLEVTVSKLKARLEELESRAISGESVGLYRSQLVGFVREAGCEVRRIDVAPPVKRVWLKEDNALLKLPASGSADQRTPFQLERQKVALEVDGTLEQVTKLMERIKNEESLAYAHRLQLQSSPVDAESVTLELELWLFALIRQNT